MLEKHSYYSNEIRGSNDGDELAPTPRRIIVMRHAENSNRIPTGSESAAWFFPLHADSPCHLPTMLVDSHSTCVSSRKKRDNSRVRSKPLFARAFANRTPKPHVLERASHTWKQKSPLFEKLNIILKSFCFCNSSIVLLELFQKR